MEERAAKQTNGCQKLVTDDVLVNLQTLCSAEWWDLVDEEVSSYEWMMITDEMIKWPRTCGGEGTLAPDYQLAQHILS